MSDNQPPSRPDREPRYQPDHSGMYELEFPAPQLSSSDGRGPVLVHALEGFSDAGHAIRLASSHLKDGPGHRAGGLLCDRRVARLPVAAAADDVQDRSLHQLRRSRTQPVRAARQCRHTVSAAGRYGAGPEVGAVHRRGAAAGRAPRCPADHRPGHRSDGGPAHPADHDDRALQQPRADRRFPRRGSPRSRSRAARPTCWNTGWLSTVTRLSASPCMSRTT